MPVAPGNVPTPPKKKKPNWFFYERFSYFDLICIVIIVSIYNAISPHIHVWWN